MCSRTQENSKNKVKPDLWDTLYISIPPRTTQTTRVSTLCRYPEVSRPYLDICCRCCTRPCTALEPCSHGTYGCQHDEDCLGEVTLDTILSLTSSLSTKCRIFQIFLILQTVICDNPGGVYAEGRCRDRIYFLFSDYTVSLIVIIKDQAD